MVGQVHTHRNFVYQCEGDNVDDGSPGRWSFRPADEPVWVRVSGPGGGLSRDRLLALLDRPEEALERYRQDLGRQSDVEGASAAAAVARQRHEAAQRSGADAAESARAADALHTAEEVLEHARKVQALLSLAAKPKFQ